MHISIEPAVSVVRWYDTGSFNNRSPYRAVCSVFYLSSRTAYIYAMHGRLTRKDMRELFAELAAQGVTEIMAERKGKIITRDVTYLLTKADLKDATIDDEA